MQMWLAGESYRGTVPPETLPARRWFIREPDYATMGEMVQLLVAFKNVNSVLEDYLRATETHNGNLRRGP